MNEAEYKLRQIAAAFEDDRFRCTACEQKYHECVCGERLFEISPQLVELIDQLRTRAEAAEAELRELREQMET